MQASTPLGALAPDVLREASAAAPATNAASVPSGNLPTGELACVCAMPAGATSDAPATEAEVCCGSYGACYEAAGWLFCVQNTRWHSTATPYRVLAILAACSNHLEGRLLK